jgi:hypothetical protein
VKGESERIDSRFLEPTCGSGNFLVPVLRRKLASVHARYGQSDFERRHQALLALMCIYGIELLDDNVAECRDNLLAVFAGDLGVTAGDIWHAAASAVLTVNIVHGDAQSMTTRGLAPRPIIFADWSYLGKGRFRRRDFRLDTMTRTASFREEDTLFSDPGKREICTPAKDYGTLSMDDIAGRRTADV